MVGASQDIATPNTYINTAVAEVLSEFADKLEKAGDKKAAMHDIIKESYGKHRRVVFNGNGYSDDWVKEAEKRGLPNVRSTPEALAVLDAPETIALFEKHHVLTKEESESRCSIYLERYSKAINIEAGVAIDMARRGIFPAATRYAASLARDASSLAAIGAVSSPQEIRAMRIAELCQTLYNDTAQLESDLQVAQKMSEPAAQAKAYGKEVKSAMEAVRNGADAIEKLVAKTSWPYPGYDDMLFKL
jgi:glutamine synthetase